MSLNYSVSDDWKVIIKDGIKEIDEIGPWDSAEGADLWGAAICEKYNSNPNFVYPGEEPITQEQTE